MYIFLFEIRSISNQVSSSQFVSQIAKTHFLSSLHLISSRKKKKVSFSFSIVSVNLHKFRIFLFKQKIFISVSFSKRNPKMWKQIKICTKLTRHQLRNTTIDWWNLNCQKWIQEISFFFPMQWKINKAKQKKVHTLTRFNDKNDRLSQIDISSQNCSFFVFAFYLV